MGYVAELNQTLARKVLNKNGDFVLKSFANVRHLEWNERHQSCQEFNENRKFRNCHVIIN